ncbi:sigma-70 family RNA polymerase sigma factor [Microbacterium testaceum]|uniref:Sigma-70 family RNA polymerase sigma factor n=1 Tax=Microbacterium testaceum TaxID=2033 RepID=A0A147EZJ5_MICTE|nr:sigma-70 family RNA polymerase sigma factor [Microbacterium testaceum]KTR95843.1 sigma-70 family RNA polymerase sigma factor [Microbacterium testaceum]
MAGIDELGEHPSPNGDSSFQDWAAQQAIAADRERDRSEERVDRLAGDRDLAAALRADGFQGRNYDFFATEIAKYGWAVIRGWIYKGQIRGEVARKGFGALDPEPRPGAMIEDAEGLADETVVLALSAFRDKVLVPGKWDPSKGASLRTFFVGQCLLQFSNVYKRWRREELRSYAEPQAPPATAEWADEFEEGPSTPLAPDASETAQIKDELRRAFGKITDERVRSAFYLSVTHGFTHAQIGEKLGMTAKAVESAIARARQQVRENLESA